MKDMRQLIIDRANEMGMDPRVLATIISYETAGSFDPTKAGPTTQWGQHRGLIQFGEPQAKQHGVDFSSPEAALNSQLGPGGAVVKYFNASGWKPGMSEMDAYSIVNAGGPGRYGASDANNGGAPGTVADKVNTQFGGHRANADALLGFQPSYTGGGPEALATPSKAAPDTGWRDKVRAIFAGGASSPAAGAVDMLAQAQPAPQEPPQPYQARPGYKAPEDSIARAYRLLQRTRGGQA